MCAPDAMRCASRRQPEVVRQMHVRLDARVVQRLTLGRATTVLSYCSLENIQEESRSGDVEPDPGVWQILQHHPARGATMQNSTRTATTDAFPNPWLILIHWNRPRTATTDVFPSSCDSSCLWNRTRTLTTDVFPSPCDSSCLWNRTRTPTTDAFPTSCDESCLWNRTRTPTTDV